MAWERGLGRGGGRVGVWEGVKREGGGKEKEKGGEGKGGLGGRLGGSGS